MKAGRLSLGVILVVAAAAMNVGAAESLWDMAKANRSALRISTLITAQNVRDYLAGESGMKDAIEWCHKTGVTCVFIESYRDNYTTPKELLIKTRDRFIREGFEVSGCVTPTRMGKQSTGWNAISCYTDPPTRKLAQDIFEYTASIFDEIMIDDFLFTDCQCEQCKQARGDKSWYDYRRDLMMDVSRNEIIGAARKINPDVKIIIKYPQWYDRFHERGYDVVGESELYDRIWVGTETRNYESQRWGRKVQYEGYFIMRWLGGIGGEKCGGGWFDPYGTTEDTYVEQARQTVLAGAREMLLFCYGSLQRDTGPDNVAKLRTEVPSLIELAKIVRGRAITGIAAPKIPNSRPEGEEYVYDFIGMMGLPLVPTDAIDMKAYAVFLPVHSMADPQIKAKVEKMIDAGKAVLLTDALAAKLDGVDLDRPNVIVLEVKGDPHRLLKLDRGRLKGIRDVMLAPFEMKFDAPNKVALYLIGDDTVVVENFNDEQVDAVLTMPEISRVSKSIVLPIDGGADVNLEGKTITLTNVSPRTMVTMRYSR